MADARLELAYQNVLTNVVGESHGLAADEITRLAPGVEALVRRVEAEREDGLHRYRSLPEDEALRRAVKAAVRAYKPRAKNLVVLGIGGSALGNIALQTALNSPQHNLLSDKKRRGPRLFVLDNVDPVQFQSVLDVVGDELEQTVFNVISKSGETAETAAQFLIVRDMLAKKLKDKAKDQLVVTTDPSAGTMREWADAEGWYTLPVPDGVGGRFSVLSAVGLFSAGMCGVQVDALLDGAAGMSKRCAERSVGKNPAAMLALVLHAYYTRGKRMHVLFPYSYQLKDLADWYRQLWAESLGKNEDVAGRAVVVGPTPINALGATDQHSQVQLYREGPNDKVFVFMEVDKFGKDVKIPKRGGTPDALDYLHGSTLHELLNAEKRATEYALVASERPCMTLHFPEVNETHVGEFIMLWEAATTLAGGLLNINPYDQPAVQMGKEFTFALMGKAGYDAQRKAYAKFAKGRGKRV